MINKRFWIICSVIGSGLLTLSVLGLSSLKMHRKGLQAERQQEFMDVAKQISFDVKKKVDAFYKPNKAVFIRIISPIMFRKLVINLNRRRAGPQPPGRCVFEWFCQWIFSNRVRRAADIAAFAGNTTPVGCRT